MLQLQNPNSDETMVTWEQLSASSGMAPNTIRDCYKMMLPYMAVVSAAGVGVVRAEVVLLLLFVHCWERAPA